MENVEAFFMYQVTVLVVES